DQATLDARSAHNEAVAAAERAEELRAAGENLLTLGGFERGTLEEIFSGYGSQPYNLDQIELVSDGGAHEGSRFIRIAGDTWRGMTQFLAEVPVTPGRTYRISVAARLAPGMTAPSGAIGWPMYWFQQDGSAHNGNWP